MGLSLLPEPISCRLGHASTASPTYPTAAVVTTHRVVARIRPAGYDASMAHADLQTSNQRRRALPRWLKRNVPKGNANHFTAKLIGHLGLQTVCDHAKCPNRMECYSQKTATFMILGDVCTRACRFCSVPKGEPQAGRRRRAAARGPRPPANSVCSHVVITCVTRDDLARRRRGTFLSKTIEAVRASTAATVEVLPSDFAGNSGRGRPARRRGARCLQP